MSARLAFYMTPAPERRKLVEFIQKNYVLVDVDGYAPGASSADVTWWTSVSGKAENDGCGNNAWYVATAGGTRLGDPVARGLPDIRKAWIVEHPNEAGDLIQGHWVFMVVEPGGWVSPTVPAIHPQNETRTPTTIPVIEDKPGPNSPSSQNRRNDSQGE